MYCDSQINNNSNSLQIKILTYNCKAQTYIVLTALEILKYALSTALDSREMHDAHFNACAVAL